LQATEDVHLQAAAPVPVKVKFNLSVRFTICNNMHNIIGRKERRTMLLMAGMEFWTG